MHQMDMANLCSREPGHSQYSEASVFGNSLYQNYSSSIAYSDSLAGHSQSRQNHDQPPIVSQGAALRTPDTVASSVGKHACNQWKHGKNEIVFLQTSAASMDGPKNHLNGNDNPQLNLQRQLSMLHGQSLPSQQPDVSTFPSQGLLLSLGTKIPVPPLQHLRPHQTTAENCGLARDENCRNQIMHPSNSHYSSLSLSSSIINSKYLKVAQELLGEVVNVQEALSQKSEKSQSLPVPAGTTMGKDGSQRSKVEGMPSNNQDPTINSSGELSPSERQDLQNKVTKLLSMLDEVSRRYKQSYHQMLIVVSSFDVVAGSGAAKPYTALALQTISRHFRCLRDAISGHIQVTRKSLGEPDNSGGKDGGISRLRYVDHQLRQQRALQQFDMVQQHAWKPQRGLPESSVTILRAWLFEHFLHPYPNDSEKLILARQTGLTRGQVSNWFINARVRLWKPMIEDMYKDEAGDTEIESNSSSDNPPKGHEDDTRSPGGRDEEHQNTAFEADQFRDSSEANIISAMDVMIPTAGLQHEASAKASLMNHKMRAIREDSSFLQDALAHPVMAYQTAEGVSLTLGLQHRDASNSRKSFLGMQMGDIYSATSHVAPPATEYDYANVGDRQHRLDSSHMLHDFVA